MMKTEYRMKAYLFFIAIGLASCRQEVSQLASFDSAKAAAERVEPALISNNQLPADGCEAHVQLDKPGAAGPVLYKPTAESLSVLEKALQSGNSNEPFWGQKAVTITFRETGKQVELTCGWGSKKVIPEIEVLKITDR